MKKVNWWEILLTNMVWNYEKMVTLILWVFFYLFIYLLNLIKPHLLLFSLFQRWRVCSNCCLSSKHWRIAHANGNFILFHFSNFIPPKQSNNGYLHVPFLYLFLQDTALQTKVAAPLSEFVKNDVRKARVSIAWFRN